MNIAILMGQSEYLYAQKLPGCKNDLKVMSDIIIATNKYKQILCLDDNCKTAYDAQNKIVTFLESLESENIEECFVYFSGHGDFDGSNFYYVWQDYDPGNKTSTCLINSDIDNLIRKISPKLFVKVIDACNSGVNYIKSLETIKKFLEENKHGFQDCYFMFSSQNSQSSYANINMSDFTRGFLQALKGESGKIIRYTNIINYLAEQFEGNKQQIPQFVVQGTLADVFCTLNDTIVKILEKIFVLRNPVISISETSNIMDSLLCSVEEDAKKYVTFSTVTAILSEIAEYLKSIEIDKELRSIFDIEIIQGKDYSAVPKIDSIADWADSAKSQLFVSIQRKKVEYKKKVPKNAFSAYSLFPSIYGGIPDDEYKTITETRYDPVGISTELSLPYQYLDIHLKSKYPNILDNSFYVVPILCRKKLYLFYSKFNYVRSNWTGQSLSPSGIKWKFMEYEFDFNNIKESLENILKVEFFDIIVNELKIRFLPESSEENNSEETNQK